MSTIFRKLEHPNAVGGEYDTEETAGDSDDLGDIIIDDDVRKLFNFKNCSKRMGWEGASCEGGKNHDGVLGCAGISKLSDRH